MRDRERFQPTACAAYGRLAIGALALLAATAGGCSYHRAYVATSLPESERATLRVVNYRQGTAAWNATVEQVDGVALPFFFRETSTDRNFLFDAPTGGEKTIVLPPGRHVLEVGLFWDQFLSGSSQDDSLQERCVLSFDALPGEHYDLASTYWRSSFAQWVFAERDWTAWVVNAGTGEVASVDECVPQLEAAPLLDLEAPWLLDRIPATTPW